MIKSENTKELFEAFANFQGQMENIPLVNEVTVRTKTGGEYKFKYSPLAKLIEASRPKLKANGLAVTQFLDKTNLVTMLTHSSGQYIGGFADMRFTPEDPQKYGSLITYLRRYNYAAILGLASEEDDDANIANGNSFTKRETGSVAAKPSNETPKDVNPSNETPNLATSAQKAKIFAMAEELGYDSGGAQTIVKNYFVLDNFEKLTVDQANKSIESLQAKITEKNIGLKKVKKN